MFAILAIVSIGLNNIVLTKVVAENPDVNTVLLCFLFVYLATYTCVYMCLIRLHLSWFSWATWALPQSRGWW